MFYIHDIACISPQKTFSEIDIEHLNCPVGGKLPAIEPAYEGIPLNILRRMGKAVRMGVGAALTIAKQNAQGIIIGTANGGMEDCIRFLNQVIDYNEGVLTPTNFVQSTANAIASQIGLLTSNRGYNCTHVHRGLAFENAVLDTAMLLSENPSHRYLLGGIDEISAYNYNIEF
ncbi:MAG: beta-ketoacyl synthase chain length factor, partial [Bacteroidetes bacterium]|nr:beta-ketoacyl synthase chain length factor [Bacteroidota bacterium]